jgi:hypothetical protein
MLQRREFAALSAAAAALSLQATAFGQGSEKKADERSGHSQHKMFQECAAACNACQQECDSCARHCAEALAQGKEDHLKTLRTCIDCAEFCSAAARIVAAEGPFSDLICESCAEACARCGKACEQFPNDEHMKRCAEECRKCEKACRDMLKHAQHGKSNK